MISRGAWEEGGWSVCPCSRFIEIILAHPQKIIISSSFTIHEVTSLFACVNLSNFSTFLHTVYEFSFSSCFTANLNSLSSKPFRWFVLQQQLTENCSIKVLLWACESPLFNQEFLAWFYFHSFRIRYRSLRRKSLANNNPPCNLPFWQCYSARRLIHYGLTVALRPVHVQ